MVYIEKREILSNDEFVQSDYDEMNLMITSLGKTDLICSLIRRFIEPIYGKLNIRVDISKDEVFVRIKCVNKLKSFCRSINDLYTKDGNIAINEIEKFCNFIVYRTLDRKYRQ